MRGWTGIFGVSASMTTSSPLNLFVFLFVRYLLGWEILRCFAAFEPKVVTEDDVKLLVWEATDGVTVTPRSAAETRTESCLSTAGERRLNIHEACGCMESKGWINR